MIVYQALRGEFTQDVLANEIEERILASFESRFGHSTSKREVESWKNSMQYMNNALIGAGIPVDAGVAIEFKVPQSAKRIDFILTGMDANDRDTAVIVELKQWSEAFATQKDAIVESFVGGGVREVPHPSYQAWTYAALVQDFNEAAHDGRIQLKPCAYLHNMEADQAIKDPFYAEHLQRAPVFAKRDTADLQRFLRTHIRRGDRKRILYLIDQGKLKPSKSLADHLVSLMQGNREFDLIDEQKLVYEAALAAAIAAQSSGKQVLIVEGGPGTGKSVVSINLLVALTRQRLVAQYVTRNAAPRAVFSAKLTGTMKKTHIGNLFKSSGAYVRSEAGEIDALIVDEAHRLNEKSGFYGNLGDHQVAEIIRASKFSVFFVDDHQRVTLKDVGEKALIREFAERSGATVREMALTSQFRCNGSDAYLAWVNNTLGIAATANTSLAGVEYDFQVFDSPKDMHERIKELNELNNKSRVVAGYCWDWKGKKDASVKDVAIPEYGYAARWNLDIDGSLWILMPNSVSEVGCIHTCQGLELDYVGVIIGNDFVVRDGKVITDAAQRALRDRSISGYKKWLKADPAGAKEAADRIIKNTYRTLMTRGMKGCFVFCTDSETAEYFKSVIGTEDEVVSVPMAAEEHPRYQTE